MDCVLSFSNEVTRNQIQGARGMTSFLRNPSVSRSIARFDAEFPSRRKYMVPYSTTGEVAEMIFRNVSATFSDDVRWPQSHDRRGFASKMLYDIAERVPNEYKEEEKLTKAVTEAAEIIALMPYDMPVPTPSVTPDCEIKLTWREGDKEAVAIFDGDGVFGAARLDGSSFVPSPKDIPVASGFPKFLAEYLSA